MCEDLYTEIPNIVFDIRLPAESLAIYCYIKRCTNIHTKDICFEEIEKMSNALGICKKTFIRYFDELTKSNEYLGGKSLISIYDDEDGSKKITINNLEEKKHERTC